MPGSWRCNGAQCNPPQCSRPQCTRAGAFAALVCATFAFAASCPAQDVSTTYPVHGVVLNFITHRPIARALVDAREQAALTDNSGRFDLSLTSGVASISVRRPGYSERGRSNIHVVNVGANMPELTFTLVPSANISGHINFADGEPADSIRIVACRRGDPNGHERWRIEKSATTDSEGEFRLADLEAPGTYLLYTMASQDRGARLRKGALSSGYPSILYPGVTDPASAGLIALAPGQQASADMVLQRQTFYPVAISISDSGSGGRPGIQVFDESGHSAGSSAHWDAAEGVERVELPNGRYYAQSQSGGGGKQLYGRVDFTVDSAPVSGLTLTLVPLEAVPVRIHKDFDVGSGDNTDEPIESSPGLNLTLTSAEGLADAVIGGSLRHEPNASDASQFELADVTPGRYWVATTPYEGYVSAITSGGTDLAREPLTIGPGNTTTPIEIYLRKDGGTISGQINAGSTPNGQSSGSPAVGELPATTVYAFPQFPVTTQLSERTIREGNQFTFDNLPPGNYRVVALDRGVDMSSLSLDERQRYLSKGQTVAVEAGGTANVQLDVLHTEDVSQVQ